MEFIVIAAVVLVVIYFAVKLGKKSEVVESAPVVEVAPVVTETAKPAAKKPTVKKATTRPAAKKPAAKTTAKAKPKAKKTSK